MRNIVDIFKDVIEGLGVTIPINTVTDNLDGTYTLLVDKTKWLRPKSQNSLATKITIGVNTYDVDSMVYNESVTITTDDDLSEAKEFSIAAPAYINGTQLSVQNARKNKNSWNVCPFVWLVEPFIADENKSKMTTIASKPDLTMLFLDNDNTNDWTTADRYSKVINPMDELVEAFATALQKDRITFQKITNWQVIRHAKFGEQYKAGHLASFINEKTSGIEVRFTVEILKDYSCCN
jgi:hypothetical protein